MLGVQFFGYIATHEFVSVEFLSEFDKFMPSESRDELLNDEADGNLFGQHGQGGS